MDHKVGRLIDHIHLRSRDLAAAKAFYKAVFDVLGIPYDEAADHLSADEFWLDSGPTPSHVHLAFQARDRAIVQSFHAAALKAGGRDYHPGYYGAFVLDPDGNNIEAVTHGPIQRSAEAVVVTVDS